MSNCDNCRFWSQMVAQSIGLGPVEALCLSEDGPHRGRYMRATDGCPAWKKNKYGSVDEPRDYGERVRTLYAEDDAKVDRFTDEIVAKGDDPENPHEYDQPNLI